MKNLLRIIFCIYAFIFLLSGCKQSDINNQATRVFDEKDSNSSIQIRELTKQEIQDGLINRKKPTCEEKISVTNEEGAFQESNGIVLFEVESSNKVDSWESESELDGYYGSSYYTWRGEDNYNNPGTGELVYTVDITNEGAYCFQIHNRHDFDDKTLENDLWMKIDEGKWYKIYSKVNKKWTWSTKIEYDKDNKEDVYFELEKGTHTIKLSARSANFSIDRVRLYHAVSMPEYGEKLVNIYKGTPVIDGDIDEIWKDTNKIDDLIVRNGMPECFANAKFLWDENYLYAYFEVQDMHVGGESLGKKMWKNDSIEIAVDEGNDKSESYDSNDWRIVVDHSGQYYYLNGVNNEDSSPIIVVKQSDSGYFVEVALPWMSLVKGNNDDGRLVGVEFAINDNKEGNESNRLGNYGWNDGKDISHKKPFVFGTMRLKIYK